MERRIPTLDEFIKESEEQNLALQYFLKGDTSHIIVSVLGVNGMSAMRHNINLSISSVMKRFEDESIKFIAGNHPKEMKEIEGELMKMGFVEKNDNNRLFPRWFEIPISSSNDAEKLVKEITDIHVKIKSKMSILDEYMTLWQPFQLGQIFDQAFYGNSLVKRPLIDLFRKLQPETVVVVEKDKGTQKLYDEVAKNGKLILVDDMTGVDSDFKNHKIEYYELKGSYYFTLATDKRIIIVKIANIPAAGDIMNTKLRD